MLEKRKQVRSVGGFPTWIEIAPDRPLVDCMLRNLTSEGAQMVVSADTPLPEHFKLCFSRNRKVVRACRMIWRNGNVLGAAFIEPERHSNSTDERQEDPSMSFTVLVG